LFQRSGEGITLLDPKGRLLAMNQGIRGIFAADLESLAKAIPGDGSPYFSEPEARGARLRTLITDQELFTRDWRITRGDGALAWVREAARPIRGDDGKLLFFALFHRDVTKSKLIEDQFLRHASFDPLTGLPNRAGLLERLWEFLRRSRGDASADFALALLDLDRFGAVNHSLGHISGDQLLAEVASRLHELMPPQVLTARLGGDEFALLADIDDPEAAARALAELIREAMSRPFVLDDVDIFLTASAGIVASCKNYGRPEHILRDADSAMLSAKHAGKDTFRLFDPEMFNQASRTLSLRNDLKKSLGVGDIFVVYQPIVQPRSGRPLGFEALARWKHPTRGLVSPAEFIPLAEETSLIQTLGLHVLKTALADLGRMRALGFADLAMSVNLSGRQVARPDCADSLIEALGASGQPAANLHLEITESVLVENAAQATRVMEALAARGASFSLDDFGTGHSSLSYLRAFPFKTLKIDRSFVADVATDPRGEALFRAILQLAEALSLSVVAEGVETTAQRDIVAALGCPAAQGWLFARAMPLEQALAWLASVRGHDG
jgi:diguanylate cyclase (GGDEF)-like protein/PAS domain S-box-containing protein